MSPGLGRGQTLSFTSKRRHPKPVFTNARKSCGKAKPIVRSNAAMSCSEGRPDCAAIRLKVFFRTTQRNKVSKSSGPNSELSWPNFLLMVASHIAPISSGLNGFAPADNEDKTGGNEDGSGEFADGVEAADDDLSSLVPGNFPKTPRINASTAGPKSISKLTGTKIISRMGFFSRSEDEALIRTIDNTMPTSQHTKAQRKTNMTFFMRLM